MSLLDNPLYIYLTDVLTEYFLTHLSWKMCILWFSLHIYLKDVDAVYVPTYLFKTYLSFGILEHIYLKDVCHWDFTAYL